MIYAFHSIYCFRISDSRMSSTSFEFTYNPHGWSSDNDWAEKLPMSTPLDLSRPGTLTLSAISRTNNSSENISISCVTCDLLKIPEEKKEVKKEATLPNARPGRCLFFKGCKMEKEMPISVCFTCFMPYDLV